MKKLNLNTPFVQKYGLPIGLFAILLIVQLFRLDLPLLAWINIKNTFKQYTSITLTALGLTFIMISGEGDMSFAGMYSLLTTVFALTINSTGSFGTSFVLVLAIALLVNIALVTLVTRFGFSSFIASIAVMFMAQGVERVLHKQTTNIVDKTLVSFVNIDIGFNFIVWAMLIIYAVSYFVITRTKVGFKLRVTGENVHAGIEAGINVNKMKYMAYIAAALCIALATVFETARTGAMYNQGSVVMLPIFAACYLGSSMFIPGRVNILGTLYGAMFVALMSSFMTTMGMQSYLISIIQGVILIASVGISVWRNRKKITQVIV
ncbi:MAG: ABC transporter permease [Bacillota bacterium]